MMSSLVTVDREGSVARVIVDHAPVNALSEAVINGLARELTRVGESTAKVVLLEGANNAFLAGADISEFPQLLQDPEKVKAHVESTRPLFALLGSIPQPVVASVRGAAVGGGLEVALACDLVVAHEAAVFAFPEMTLGLIPGGGGTQRLPRIVGRIVASRLIMGAETLRADDALRMGIISHIAPDGEHERVAIEVAGRLGSMSRQALTAAKRALRDGLEQPLPTALGIEEDLFVPLFGTEDAREGYAAFTAKRAPRFS